MCTQAYGANRLGLGRHRYFRATDRRSKLGLPFERRRIATSIRQDVPFLVANAMHAAKRPPCQHAYGLAMCRHTESRENVRCPRRREKDAADE